MQIEELKRVLYSAIADIVKVEATNRMRSRTLRRDLQVRLRIGLDQIVLSLPYYWAEYAHDGRQAIDLPPGRYMIFFPDSQNDPRTNFGTSYPRAYEDRNKRRLTDAEYKFFQAENRLRRANGEEPIMVVTRHVGPSQGEFFFSLAWTQLVSSGVVDGIVSASIKRYLQLELGRSFRVRGVANL